VVACSRTLTVDDLTVAARTERGGADRHPRPDLSTQFEPPRSDPERVIAEIWAEALGLVKVGTNDNFFELGGNSLIGVSIVDRVRKALGLRQLPAHVIYQAPTVGALALAATGTDQPAAEPNRRALAQRARLQRRRESQPSRRPA
jgi:acyl carrier protein